MDKIKEEYLVLGENTKRLRRLAPDVMKENDQLNRTALKAGELEVKMKELVALGIAVGVRCEGCIMAHVRNAVNAGASLQELTEVV